MSTAEKILYVIVYEGQEIQRADCTRLVSDCISIYF